MNIRSAALLAFIFATVATGFSQTVDLSFPNLNGTVFTLATQPDGKVLIGGSFTKVGNLARTNIVRLNADGTVDTNFNAWANNTVYALAVQDDGAIVVGGNFTNLSGFLCPRFGRLTRDGAMDPSFNPGASNTVYALAIQPDGDILAGGTFTIVAGQTRNSICRMTKSGVLDAGFNPGADNRVTSLVVQINGSIVVGGWFGYLGGQARNHLGRLDTNGNLDTSFSGDADGMVFTLALQADNSIVVGGQFKLLSSQSSPFLGRITADGLADSSFHSSANSIVYSFALQTDGKILVSGAFTNVSGQACSRIGRLNTDGTLDASFNAGASNNTVYAVALQSDGHVLAAGAFTNASGLARTNLVRYSNTGAASQSLALSGSTLTWARGGVSPEVWHTQFEASTNGNGWQSLGAGTRVAGGWQVTGVAIPASSSFRARGFTTSGQNSGSQGMVELVTGKPVIASAPTNLTSVPTSNVLFSVAADGPGPLYYQWRKGGAILNDSGNIRGAQNVALIVSNVFGSDAGGYSVVVSNASGAVTSSIAQLTVLDPFVAVAPSNQWINAGDAGTFAPTVIGTGPFTYQWLKGGTNINGATGASLIVTNAQRADIGNYSVIVGNNFGATTSAVAVLSVNLALSDNLHQDADAPVHAFAVQPDGQILVGGEFTSLGGSNHAGLARLHADGTLDPNFTIGVSGLQYQTYVNAFAIQPDENVLVGGSFIRLGSKNLTSLGRFDTNGIEDTTFGPILFTLGYEFVSCLAIQTNQQILAVGCFDQFIGGGHTNIGRVGMDGTVDPLFKAGTEEAVYPTQGRVFAMAQQPDGKILIGGVFTNLWGQTRNRIGRLNADGTLDSGFNPGADGTVDCMAVQPDGNILVGGAFSQIGGQPRSRLARLDTNGIVDPNFNPGADAYVGSLVLQANGGILVGGAFATLAGQPCRGIGRLHTDGSIDLLFNPLANGNVYSLAQQADGSVLAGGAFDQISGQPRKNLARLTNPDPATQTFTRSNSTITWLRGGSSPEITRAYFEACTDGVNWFGLGDGSRIAGGWQLTNVSTPGSALLRARGVVLGGDGNGSSWLVETKPGKPLLKMDSAFGIHTNHFGFNISEIAGRSVIIESSTDLKNWAPVGTNQPGYDEFYFSDPNALDARRFYRARTQ